ncbi:T9SS type A sorting domain-containing protein [uncultured Kordia sp.]|uniref:T9SS type A sorting domain-containing protein n=1 Tax=uncultured Kordia sp. TaxID=507699 RepID=UPI002619C950|nr:T9SS type A sorting domain-containing protein [uncultured Kordia sp.]
MKKIFFIFLLITTVCFSQEIHDIPTSLGTYYQESPGNEEISDENILIRIDTIFSYLNGTIVDATLPDAHQGEAFENHFRGVVSVYYSKRILAHIQLYYYYSNQGATLEANDQKDQIAKFFDLFLGEQCTDYSPSQDAANCSFSHGGFPAEYQGEELPDDPSANPLPTALALKVFAEVRNLYDSLGEPVPIIGCDEFEDRVYQAKHALYTYQQINYQYLNMTGFTQIGATSIHELYDDAWSMDFLMEKATELFDQTGPLRPYEGGDPDWDKDWNEGQQADGSWKDYGAIYVIGDYFLSANGVTLLDLNECQKWHDSELDYHSIITEGLAYLYSTLEEGDLKDKTRKHLVASINHVIDYDGQTTHIENPFNPLVTGTGQQQTRLTNLGRITKYHREADLTDCLVDTFVNGSNPRINMSDGLNDYIVFFPKRSVGIGFLRSLILSRNYLDGLPTAEQEILDALIAGLTREIINVGGGPSGSGYKNLPYEQLYDLSLYLNRKNLNNIQKNRSKDKAVAAFKFDDTNTATIVSHKENTTLTLDFNEAIYSHNQEAVDMLSGDFNGNGSDELIITFDGGNTYRYRENSAGFMDTPTLIYSTNGGTIKSEKLVAGDFNGNGIDELIVTFSDNKMKKYGENNVGQLVENDTFYLGAAVTHMEVGDFNGDSVDELIVVNSGGLLNTITRYHQNSTGNIIQGDIIFSDATVYPLHIEVGNFNEDSKDELIVAFSDGTVTRYKDDSINANSNTNNLVTDTSENFYQNSFILPTHLEAGDFNLDGEDELVIAFNNKKISIYEEDETTGYMTFEQNFYSGNQPCSGLSAGDFDGDGVDELLVGFINTVYRCIENSAGVMQLKSSINHNGDDVNLITTLRRNRIHCPGGASSRAANTTRFNAQIVTTPFNAMLVSGEEALTLSVKNQKVDTSILKVYDITGRLLLSEQFEKSIQIARSKLNSGMYIFSIENGSDKKIIKTIN